jgi:hypothetical protein
LVALLAWLPASSGATPIVMLYSERPPQMLTRAGAPAGLSMITAWRAFEDAGIAFVWQKVEPEHEWEAIAANRYPVCSPGWDRTPERDAVARFTRPLHRDGPLVAVANPHFVPPPGTSLEQLLDQPGVDVLLAQGASHDAAVNARLAAMRAQRLELRPAFGQTGLAYGQVAAMVAAGRAELTLMPADEVPYQLAAAGLSAQDINVLALPGMPPGVHRHIACSRQVDEQTIARLNKVIESWGSLLPEN